MKKKNKPNEYINNNSTKAKVKDDDGEWGKHRTKTCNVDSVCVLMWYTLVKVMNYSEKKRRKKKKKKNRKGKKRARRFK